MKKFCPFAWFCGHSGEPDRETGKQYLKIIFSFLFYPFTLSLLLIIDLFAFNWKAMWVWRCGSSDAIYEVDWVGKQETENWEKV